MSVLKNASIVVVHGAWADGSSWERVIRALQKNRFNVVAAPIPLTSLSDDAAALKRTIERTHGPVIVAGHAYGGAVVGTATDERVKALADDYLKAYLDSHQPTRIICRLQVFHSLLEVIRFVQVGHSTLHPCLIDDMSSWKLRC